MAETSSADGLWHVIESQVVYEGRRTVVKDRLRKPTGDEMDYTYIAGRDVVAVLAFVDRDSVVLTRQYRHPLRRTIYDLPAGGVHENEECRDAAQRELREETGYTATELALLGRFYPAPGIRSSTVHIYVAHSVEAGRQMLDEHEIIEIVLMPWDDVLKLVLAENAVDSSLAYAVLRYAFGRESPSRLGNTKCHIKRHESVHTKAEMES